MCVHASSGKEINERISGKLYPLIDGHIQAVEQYIKQSAICAEASLLFEHFYRLKAAFGALKDYMMHHVFPAVLSVFDTKDKPAPDMPVPLSVLQQTASEKENTVMLLVSDMEQEAEWLQLPDTHPVAGLVAAFTTAFARVSLEWRSMLQGWNNTCACFAAAQIRVIPQSETTIDFAQH